MHVSLQGMHKFLCKTCYSIDRFDGPTLQVARAAAAPQSYTPQDIRTYFSSRCYLRISIRRAVQNYPAYTGIPSFSPTLCSFLDFHSATNLIVTDSITVSVGKDVFLTPTSTRPIITRTLTRFWGVALTCQCWPAGDSGPSHLARLPDQSHLWA